MPTSNLVFESKDTVLGFFNAINSILFTAAYRSIGHLRQRHVTRTRKSQRGHGRMEPQRHVKILFYLGTCAHLATKDTLKPDSIGFGVVFVLFVGIWARHITIFLDIKWAHWAARMLRPHQKSVLLGHRQLKPQRHISCPIDGYTTVIENNSFLSDLTDVSA